MSSFLSQRGAGAAATVVLSILVGCARHEGPLLAPNEAELAQPAPDSFRVDMETSRGKMTVMARRAWAPHGVDRFYYLTKHHYYDSTYFFRVVENFVAQFGISGQPTVNTGWEARRIPDDPVRHPNTRGTIAFASEGPNTRTVQLFINLRDNPKLDSYGGGFPPIAEVIDGLNVAESLYDGYGEGAPAGLGPRQELIMNQGNDYLRHFFPRLDLIQRATIAQEWR
ncbi:MAG TPA: peptidylprolyl isomerase [Gemmatimonadaceae bacterium]|jgi:peptidyl-prolyl cis-trans isomerase A (cyclophilin A)